MQDNPALQVQPQSISLSEFLLALFQALDNGGVQFCVLRNYEGFPARNVGSDLDILIYRSDLSAAVRALRSIQGIRIVGYAERYYVAHTFVEGVSPAVGIRALAVDFIWNLNWKGLPYLRTDTVMQEATRRNAGNLSFLVPSPFHEAIISLLSSLLIGRTIKEKYFPKVQEIFAGQRSTVITALTPSFGLKAATRLVDSVKCGDREKIQDCVTPLRVLLALRNLLRRPVHCFIVVFRYYMRELAVRCTPKTIESICILSPVGYNKTGIIESLVPLLLYTAKLVERRNLGSQFTFGRESLNRTTSVDYRAKARSKPSVSKMRIARWLLEEWLSQFRKKDNLTLRIIENGYYDILINAEMYRDRVPTRFARLVVQLLPSCDLWILLDPATEGSQSRNGEVPSSETLRQIESYRSFVNTRKKYVILDANKPAASVTENAYAAIIEAIAQRTERQLRSRSGLSVVHNM
ncbi:MAG: hypothetical protein ABSC77_06690 [Terracidiphilus sp.]|jgi:hypothetical protein